MNSLAPYQGLFGVPTSMKSYVACVDHCREQRFKQGKNASMEQVLYRLYRYPAIGARSNGPRNLVVQPVLEDLAGVPKGDSLFSRSGNRRRQLAINRRAQHDRQPDALRSSRTNLEGVTSSMHASCII
ncbi:hypothetical protein VNO77_31562 [Canavalia gladiata]|uniref:Uncharacterized protein n=1 Tax=Canavalia gladiata TaxID=3824 RepID=A0AAN9KRS2_CANGL